MPLSAIARTGRVAWLRVRSALAQWRSRVRRTRRTRIRGLRADSARPSRGAVMVSYRAAPLLWPDQHRGFSTHSNAWEAREVARIFMELGYSVDAIDWDDATFEPPYPYAVVFDIHRNLTRLSSAQSRRFFHVTGSHPAFSTAAELQRLELVWRRRGVRLKPRRVFEVDDIAAFDRNLAAADVITLLGNAVTQSTIPEARRAEVHLVPATGAPVARRQRNAEGAGGKGRRAFLWFGGPGAVHKGLDLVLEVFARNPDLVLHCVGPYERELDFVAAYQHELYGCPNIHSHGFLRPSGARFQAIAEQTFAFVAPSCSEGLSTAAVTCMYRGMIPIVSVRCGIDLPEGCGFSLAACSLQEVEDAVRGAAALSDNAVREAMMRTEAHALSSFSRDAFSRRMREIIVAEVGRS